MTAHERLAEWSGAIWPWLLNHLWEATLFSGIVFLVIVSLRRAPARARYAVWLMASIKFAVPSAALIFLAGKMGFDFSWLVAVPSSAPSTPPTVSIFQIVEPALNEVEVSAVSAAVPPVHSEIYCALTLLWLMGCALLLARWAKRHLEFSRALQSGTKIETGREAETLKRLKSWLLINREITLIISPEVTEPGVWGIRKPTIVLPETMADHLSDSELDAVLLHELAHVLRRDNLVSSLHMLLCCLFWFHPVVWLIDRRLLAEREQRCDEWVVQLADAATVYAKSLLKVFQFGLQWKMAGVSRATGSNLRRRIEHIMMNEHQTKLSLMHRVLLGAAGSALVIVSLVAGALNDALAQESQSGEKEKVTVVTGAAGVMRKAPADSGSSPDGVFVFAQDAQSKERFFEKKLMDPEAHRAMIEKLSQYPDVPITYEILLDAPLSITDAAVKVVSRDEYLELREIEPDDVSDVHQEYMTLPNISFSNNTDQRITSVGVAFKSSSSDRRAYIMESGLSIEPRGSYRLGSGKNHVNFWMPGSAADLTASVMMVQFEDGSHWVNPSNNMRWVKLSEAKLHQDGAGIAVLRKSLHDAQSFVFVDDASVSQPEGNVTAASGFVVVREKSAGAVEEGKVEARLHETRKLLELHAREISETTPGVPILSSGKLLERAINRVQPDYPALARDAKVGGSVMVEVTIDELGQVIETRVLNGHPLLRQAALDAARQWTFKPYSPEGTPVQTKGILFFQFRADQ